MFFRCSRMLSVSPPSPMEVKKLMLKRMLRGVSCKHMRVCYTQRNAAIQAAHARHHTFCCKDWEGGGCTQVSGKKCTATEL